MMLLMLMFLLLFLLVSVLGYSLHPERNFRCYRDLCTYDEQFCNWKEQRCKNCEDFSDYCGEREQPQNCSVYCGKFLIQQTLVSCRANCSGQTPHPTTSSPTSTKTTTPTKDIFTERTEEHVEDNQLLKGIGIGIGVTSFIGVSFLLCYLFKRRFPDMLKNDKTTNSRKNREETVPLQNKEPDNGNKETVEPKRAVRETESSERATEREENLHRNEPWKGVSPTSPAEKSLLLPNYCGKREQPNNCSVFCGNKEPDNGNKETAENKRAVRETESSERATEREENLHRNEPWKGVSPTSPAEQSLLLPS